jgi:antitoxin component YwqK of YwqJK toxin-antitoxin module
MRKSRFLLFLLITTLMLFSCVSPPQEEPISEEVSVPEEPQFRMEQITEYLVSQVIVRFPDGKMDSKKIFKYDEEGKLLLSELYSAEDLLLLSTNSEYQGGVKIKESLNNQIGLVTYTEFAYLNGQISEEFYFDAQGRLLSGSRFSYDEEGRKVMWISLDKEGAPIMKTHYIYQDGLLVRLDFLTPFDEPDGYTLYTYQENNLLEEVSYNSMDDVQKRTKWVFEAGLPVEETIYFGPRISRVLKNQFDVNGQLIYREVSNRRTDQGSGRRSYYKNGYERL